MALSQVNKKNANPDKYIYSGYGIGLDSRSEFQLPYGSVGENVIIFGVDLSSSGNIENEKKRYILGTILSIDPTQGLDDTTLTAETKYSINFSISNKDFCLRLHCNGRNGFFQPVHNVPRISPYGPVLVEAPRTIIEPKQDVLGF